MKYKILIAVLFLLTTLSAQRQPADISDCVGMWDLAEWNNYSTTKFYDGSGNGNVATSANTPSLVADQTGCREYAQSFNGSSDYDTVGNVGNVKTFVFWIYPTAHTKNIVDINATTYIDINASSEVVATNFNSATYYVNGVASQDVTLNAWNHVVVTDDTNVNASALVFGHDVTYFTGYASYFGVYSTEKSATWVAGQYTAGQQTANLNVDAGNTVPNGDFEEGDGTDPNNVWPIKLTGATVSGGQLTLVSAGATGIIQNNFAELNYSYSIVVDVAEYTLGTARIEFGGTTVLTGINSVGLHVGEATYSTSASNDRLYIATGTGVNMVINSITVTDITAKVTDPLAGSEFYMPLHEDWNYTDYLIDLSAYSNDGYIDGATVGATYTTFTTDDYIDVGNTGRECNTVGFWCYPTATSAKIIDFDGSHIIVLDAGSIVGVNFDTPSYYVDGVSTPTVAVNTWQYVMITTATGFTVDNFDIGRISSDYFEGNLAEFEFWNRVLDSDEISTAYDRHRGVYK